MADEKITELPPAEYPDTVEGPRVEARDVTAAGYHAMAQTAFAVGRQGTWRSLAALAVVNQKGGFDCPSCAWPDPDGHRSFAEFCENGAKAVAWEATEKRIGPAFFAEHSVAQLATQTERWLGDQGRITHPLILREGHSHYEELTWDEAFSHIAGALNTLDSPDEALFYTSGRASNEAAFVYQLFARQLGTNNLPDCSNMCHESSSFGLNQQIGIGKGSVKLSDFEHADTIFMFGQNPGTNHPRMLSVLEIAARRGCKIVSINPLKETGMMRFKHPQSPRDMLGAGTQIASLFCPVRINGDVAFLKGMMKELLALDEKSGGGVLDHKFIADQTRGFAEFAADIRDTSWDDITLGAGVPRELIVECAALAANSKAMITTWAMGITQHKNGVANVQLITALNLMLGQIGRVGAGICPVRGHSNVQGDRTMGIWEQMGPKFLDPLGKEFAFTPPQHHGLDTVRGYEAMHDGRIKVFVGLGGNFLSAGPDTEFAAAAFARVPLVVQISTKLNRGHLVSGRTAIILPCLGRTEIDRQASGEQFVSCENSMGVVQESRGRLEPASSHLMSEVAIVCNLAAHTLRGRTRVDWLSLCADYDRIRTHIEHVLPDFHNYNARVRQPGGFYLSNAPRDTRTFETEDKKARFFVHPLPHIPLAEGELLMMSIRSHDQFNTTIYGEDDRYRGIKGGRRVVFIHAADAAARGLVANQLVDVTSEYDARVRKVSGFKIVPYDIPRGCVAMYYPEANPLVPLHHAADGSNQPASKSVVVRLHARPASL